ncbi:cathepsin O-like [Oppia nitens]|uniref:cathepsin O-like n=1 Tax=Oppia nitens TaxID=1686743 RepID=UPI0023DB7367|nr:cathepsin O-like [Oppia nitens]
MSYLLILLINGVLIGNNDDNNIINNKFNCFVNKYNKTYKTDSKEFYKRRDIFQDSLNHINWLNNQRISDNSAVYGITRFSDLTPQEFQQIIQKHVNNQSPKRRILKTKKRSFISSKELKTFLKDVPQKVDYRQQNAVTKVINQGDCGACWALSIVETIETMVALKTSSLRKYSVQQLIDCANEDNKGCDGGDTCAALVWMAENNVRLQTADKYPTTGTSGKCKQTETKHGIAISGNFTCDNFISNEPQMVRLLANHGPLVVAVDAKSWQHYLGGVIQYHCQRDLNHAVQIVGYDLTGDIPYYIIRNTWDTSFGIDGYLHIAIGNNLCGIAEEVSAFDVVIE